ncbi:MAG: DNA repair protein RecO [Acidobacteriota bacterium]|nr:DNA repair protein RecO [Blastocatellia bacterium]MDW8412231.1 DNA repair protein RecO [Acidobacteriota bacterium]
MGLKKTEAFVLLTYPLAETHKICVLFTRNSGIVRAVAHGARRIRSRFGSSLEPFTEVQVTYFEKEGRELVRLEGCDILRSYFEQVSQPEKAAALSYVTELLCAFLPANDPNEKVYRLVSAVVNALAADADLDSLLRYFEVWLLKLSGFFPDLRICAGCDSRIDPTSGVWVANDGTPLCYSCSEGRGTHIEPSLGGTVDAIFKLAPAAFARLDKPHEHLVGIGNYCYKLIRRSLERDLKSYGLMVQLRADIINTKR